MAGHLEFAGLLLLFVGLSTGKNYCQLCKSANSHTMCQFPEEGPGSQCTGYQPTPFTDEEKATIVKLHNQLRSKVAMGNEKIGNPGPQPEAANMMQVFWSSELATIAQRWADQCIAYYSPHQHDKCRNTEQYYVGQNVAAGLYPGSHKAGKSKELEGFINLWYNEVKVFDPTSLDNFEWVLGTAHYTQQVWAKTQAIGCGRVAFTENAKGSKKTVERLVCNYGPAGNYIDEAIYLRGEPCSKCPDGTTCSTAYKGLCLDPKYASAAEGRSNTIKMQYEVILFIISLNVLFCYFKNAFP